MINLIHNYFQKKHCLMNKHGKNIRLKHAKKILFSENDFNDLNFERLKNIDIH